MDMKNTKFIYYGKPVCELVWLTNNEAKEMWALQPNARRVT